MREFLTTPQGILALWLAAINMVTFFTFGLDKSKAKHPGARRIPEKTLFTLAIVGGSVGALLGMRFWHHKTLHNSFRLGIPLILLVQVLLPVGLLLLL